MIFALVLASVMTITAKAQSSTLTKDNIEKILNDAYNKFKDLKEGKNAD